MLYTCDDLKTNYLKGLIPSYGIVKWHRFSRYLALAMEDETFKLCEKKKEFTT